MQRPDEWWNDHDTIVSLARWMVSGWRLSNVDAVVDFLEKPWNYGDDHDDMRTQQMLEGKGIDFDVHAGEFRVRDSDGDLWMNDDGYTKHVDCGCGSRAVATRNSTPLCITHLEESLSDD